MSSYANCAKLVLLIRITEIMCKFGLHMLVRESSLLTTGIRPVLLFALFRRPSVYIRAYLERPLFFGFRGSRFGRRGLWVSLPQRTPEKQRRTTFGGCRIGVPRRFLVETDWD